MVGSHAYQPKMAKGYNLKKKNYRVLLNVESLPKSKTINFGFFADMIEKRSTFAGKNTENHSSVFSSDLDI